MGCVDCIFEKLNIIENKRVRTNFIHSDDYSILCNNERYKEKYVTLFTKGDENKVISSIEGNEEAVIVIDDDWKGYDENVVPFWMCLIWDNYRTYLDYRKLYIVSNLLEIKLGEMLNKLKDYCNKELLVAYGNCQVMSINSIIETSKNILSNYIVLNVPPVYEIKSNETLKTDVIKQIDVLIYQKVADDNRWSLQHATNYIIDNLCTNAKKVCIPNIYYDGYFPQTSTLNKYNPMKLKFVNGLMPYADKNIEKLYWEENLSADEISRRIVSEDFYLPSEVIDNSENSILELKEREKVCDVIISDIIESKYKEKRLFYSLNHPINEIILLLVKRAFQYLNIKCDDISMEKSFENSGRIIPIYPSVEKALGLTFSQDKFFYHKGFQEEPVDIIQYCKDYINYCFENNEDI